MARVVAILGDGLALPDNDYSGPPFTRYVEDALEQYGVEVLNWSKQEQQAVILATEKLEELQELVKGVTSSGKELFVIIALGALDRVDFADMLTESLGMLLRVVIAEGARPLLMEVVPDGVDRSLAKEQGAGFISAPAGVAAQFDADPSHPFKPKGKLNRDIAQSVLQVLEEEMHLPLTSPNPLVDDDADDRRGRGNSRSRATHDDDLLAAVAAAPPPVVRSAGSGPFEGVWIHKDRPDMDEIVKGSTIVSEDGSKTQMIPIDNNSFFIELEGNRLTANRRGGELHWDDGDIWCLKQDTLCLDRPPAKKKGSKGAAGDLKSLTAAWAKAEEAMARTLKERQKFNPAAEKDRVEAERSSVQELREQLKGRQQLLHEETEKVSAIREVGAH